MNIKICIIAVFAQLSLTSYSQSDTFLIAPKPMFIDDFIEHKANNKQQQNLLVDFRKSYSEEDRITVEEFPEYYQIIIDHPTNNLLLGGAECYQLDKKTGESKMIWHEHPVPLPEIEDIPVLIEHEDSIKR